MGFSHEFTATAQIDAVIIAPLVLATGAVFAEDDIIATTDVVAIVVPRFATALDMFVGSRQDDVTLTTQGLFHQVQAGTAQGN